MEEEASLERELTVDWRQIAPGEWIAQLQDVQTGERFTIRNLLELKRALAAVPGLEAACDETEGEVVGYRPQPRGS